MRTKTILMAALLMVGVTATSFAQNNNKAHKRPTQVKREMPAPRAMSIDCAMATTMKLSLKQINTIGQSKLDTQEAIKAIRSDKELSRADKSAQMKEVMAKQKETIKKTLSEEQYIIYLEQQTKGQPEKGCKYNKDKAPRGKGSRK